MRSFYKRYYKTVFDIALIVLTVYLFMWLFSLLYDIASPIFLAFLIFLIIEPPARWLHRRGVKKAIASAISTIVFVLLLLALLTGLGAVFASQIYNLAERLPDYQETLQKQIEANTDYVQNKLEGIPAELTEKIKEFVGTVIGYGSRLAANFLEMLFNWITSISSFVINFAIGIILAYFLSIEIDMWRRVAHEKTPATFKKAYFFLKDNVLKGIAGYLKAQFTLIAITFVVIYIALLLLGVNNAFSISLLAALFDLLPLLGVSTIFIPWIVYLFAVGDTALAIWLTVLLGAVILTRQILEPKITGDTLGVSAFTMLAFMVISLSLFGVAGLIISPVLIILIKQLYVQGYFHRWIRLPEGEFDD